MNKSGYIYSSSDYSFSTFDWTRTHSDSSGALWGVTYGNSTFVTVGDSRTILTSSDGTTWTSRSCNIGSTIHLYGIAYGNGTFVAVSSSGSFCTSSDGPTWTARASGVNKTLNGVGYGNNTFVAVGQTGTIH